MKTIFKYPLTFNTPAPVHVMMPLNAQILSIQVQGGEFVLWALVDRQPTSLVQRTFWLFGAGWDIPANPALSYLATVQAPNSLVWHFFEQV